jgi:hypothetical protein
MQQRHQDGKLRWGTERHRRVAFWLALATAAIVCGRLVGPRCLAHYRWHGHPRRRPSPWLYGDFGERLSIKADSSRF